MTPQVRAGDIAVVALIALFAWLGLRVHDSIAGLGEMAQGIEDTGTAIQRSGRVAAGDVRRSVGRAADAAESVPLVGGNVAAALRDTARTTSATIEREARATGAQLVASGRRGEEDARTTARLVGWLAFLIPTVALLAQVGPQWSRRWRAAAAPAPESPGGPPSG
ncbi:MAG TPA: hypothetical protein VN213_14680 [Solirubrobacteraceae bacterium]|nr:hypothetical protein [Solirubrobacteraceae bacterium]